MSKSLLSLLLFAFSFSFRAGAEPDTFGLGTGRNGALTISAVNTVINSYAPVTTGLVPGTSFFSIGAVRGAAAGFAVGDLVMVWQTGGLIAAPASGAAGPFNLTNNAVGGWEFARLASVSGSSLTLTMPLIYTYAGGATQVVRVPEHTTVTVNSGRSVIALPWDGQCGGMVAFLASSTVSLFGQISASGAGFRGGLFVNDFSGATGAWGIDEPAPAGAQRGEGVAPNSYGPSYTGSGNKVNAGGGGIAYLSGGGGGSNAAAGGSGGHSSFLDGARPVGGRGGGSLTYDLVTQLMLGGGGGAGHGDQNSGQAGGSGGGVVFIRCNTTTGAGSILASGNTPTATTSDGGSGGGAGGTIYLRTAGNANFGAITARGGNGGSVNDMQIGPGGGGSGGNLLLQRSNGSGTVSLTGGSSGNQQDPAAPGGSAYGATAGINGTPNMIMSGMPTPTTPVIGAPAGGSVTNARPAISGTAPAFTAVALYLDGLFLANLTADGAGNYSYTPAANFTDGAHTLRVYTLVQGLYSTAASVSFNSSVALPLRLIQFTASRGGGGVKLDWTTVEEERTAYFGVERSTAAGDFVNIGRVASRNGRSQSYQFTDAAAFSGPSQYRLKIVDADSSFRYSHVLSVGHKKPAAITVFPNPAVQTIYVEARLQPGVYPLRLVNADGRVVCQQSLKGSGGSVVTTIDVRQLPPGLYVLQLDGMATTVVVGR